MSIIANLADHVQHGIEECFDKYENREIIGGAIGSIYDPPATRYEYYLTIDGEEFSVIIERRLKSTEEGVSS